MIVFARNLVVKDFWLKLFSFALAILIWLTVKFTISGEGSLSAIMGRAPDESVLTVPVHVPAGTPQNFVVEPAEITVTLRGDPKSLKSVRAENIRAQVDLTGVEAANGLLRPVEIVVPKNITYTHLSQDEVEVRVAPRN